MILFKKRKLRVKKLEETKQKMKELFEKKVKDFENYNLLYGYTATLESYGYIYQSKIIAYREKDMTLIVLDTDKDFKKVYNLKKFKRGEFKRASYNKVKDTYYIEKNELKSSREKFIIIDKNYEDDDILAFINQEDDIDDFIDFFLEFKRRIKRKDYKDKNENNKKKSTKKIDKKGI